MWNDRYKFCFVTNCCWLTLSLFILTTLTASNVIAFSIQQTHKDNDELGGHVAQISLPKDQTEINLNPHLQYNNEWRPVGRGDPLKNDPTYDYSPPALERVRYWRADNETKENVEPTNNAKNNANYANNEKYSKDFLTNNKNEILLLGMPNDRHRGQLLKSESLHLQPKYTSIRRSYYAHQHQLPTHLMPPPMQTLSPPGHLMKSNTMGDYRHNMPSSATTTMSMTHSKPFYTTSASSPWMHSSSPAMTSTLASSPVSAMMQHHYRSPQNTPHVHFEHHDVMNQFSHTRPSLSVSYAPNNFIDSNPNSHKYNMHTGRKPWLHELLQKEVVKVPPKMASHKYPMNNNFVTPAPFSMSTTHTNPVFIAMSTTSTPKPEQSTTVHVATTSPVYFTSTYAPMVSTTSAPLVTTPVSTTPSRLLIPTTNNLVHRPTVAPMKMTTDALFKHYNQPEEPLLGPMYLIIEGHSKVKTYGKDELDPHRPKIVPIIPKREPIVRIADPNERRGTLETFNVKHLHTKTTTPVPPTTTSSTRVSTKVPETAINSTTTVAPKSETSTSTIVKSSNSTTTTTTTTTTTAFTSDTSTDSPPTGMEGFFNFLDSSLGNLFRNEPSSPNPEQLGTHTSSKPDNIIFVTTPPSSTKLHPINTQIHELSTQHPEIEARIGTHSGSINSLVDFENDNDEADVEATTEPGLRDIRQVFDYDQLPELRIKNRMDVNINEDDKSNEDDPSVEAASLADDSLEDIDMEDIEKLTSDDDYEEEDQKFIKRIDKLVDDDNEENEFEELLSAEVDSDDIDDDDDDDDLEMRHAKKASN